VNDPLAWIDDESARCSALGLGRRLVARGPAEPGRFLRDGRSLVNFGSNDYLGLAADPRVAAAAAEAARLYGWGSGASPLVGGWTDAHRELSRGLAAFLGAEAALLFPSGYAANLGAIAALVGPGDAVYCDRRNHACLIDGVKLAGARLRVYPHADAGRLDEILARDAGRFRRRLIATDGVFSMDGDLAPLADLADLADRFDAALLVDEAHGTGVHGPDGRGAGSACGVHDRIPVHIGTLSKALGSVGGFAAGSRRLVDWLTNNARTQIYSTALPAAAAAAALAALRISQSEPWRRDRVHAHARRLRESLTAAGHYPGGSAGPIVPVPVGDPFVAMALSGRLRDLGLFVPAIRPPTVPAGTSRLRVSLSAAHDDGDLDRLIAALGPGRPGDGPAAGPPLV